MNRKRYISHKKGFSLVEMLVVILLVAAFMGGGFSVFSVGQATWFNSDVQIRIQENLRKSLERISMELRQAGSAQQQISNGAGFGGTDVLRFSMPVLCETGESLIDNNGDVAHWGAPLTWGCTTPSCMDADDDCDTVDYRYVEYKVNTNNRLQRAVLDNDGNTVRTDEFASEISDFQVTVNGNVTTLMAESEITTQHGNILSEQETLNVFMRN